MKILGICGGVRLGNWDAAAALIVDGKICAAAEEERFTRVKHAPGNLPTHAIRYCLASAGLRIQDIDLVVFPGLTYKNIVSRLSEYFKMVFGHAPKIELCDHHQAHAAVAFYTSGLKDSLVVTYDFSGDGFATTVSQASREGVKVLERWPFPQSLGLFYAIMTQHLGFDFGEDEYKVMGLASYGTADVDLSWLLKSTSEGYALDPEILRRSGAGEPPFSPQEPFSNELLSRRVGPSRIKAQAIGKEHHNLAASAQAQLERVVLDLVARYQRQTQAKNLCVAGGVAMNCVLNQKIAESGLFERVFVPPVAGDNGLALGAALTASARFDSHEGFKLETAALGPSYDADQIRKSLEEVGASFTECADPAAAAAEMIAQGLVIGWFQGRMEYGARALGHRSILADPRIPEMKNRVNAVIKFREGFRPFAPSVALESAGAYFEKPYENPFMTSTFSVRPEMREKIPAVTHVDGTARVQTVNGKSEPLYYSLLSGLGKRTGIPIALNTSFNVRGQPIVENPNQAISTYYGSGLDALVIGPFVLRKKR